MTHTDQNEREGPDTEETLREEQRGKGYGEDEGEREEAVERESDEELEARNWERL